MKKIRSGFDCPVYGEILPKGTTFKKNNDGTVTIVLPKEKSKKEAQRK